MEKLFNLKNPDVFTIFAFVPHSIVNITEQFHNQLCCSYSKLFDSNYDMGIHRFSTRYASSRTRLMLHFVKSLRISME